VNHDGQTTLIASLVFAHLIYCVISTLRIPKDLRTGRRKVDKKTFVEAQVFDEIYKGGKFEHLFGPLTKATLDENEEETAGHWIKGDFQTFMPGHHLFEDYKDSSVNVSTVHEDGSLILQQDQALSKYAALAKERSADQKKSDEAMTSLTRSKGGAGDILKMMQQLHGSAGSGGDAPDQAASDEELDEGGDGSSGEEHAQARPTSMFARLRGGSAQKAPTKQRNMSPPAGSASAGHALPSSGYLQ